jgi:hypothetical protein
MESRGGREERMEMGKKEERKEGEMKGETNLVVSWEM